MPITIDEAIESINEVKKLDCHVKYQEWQDALQLGIEALKFVASWNQKQLPQHRIHLPGETEI